MISVLMYWNHRITSYFGVRNQDSRVDDFLNTTFGQRFHITFFGSSKLKTNKANKSLHPNQFSTDQKWKKHEEHYVNPTQTEIVFKV